MNKLAKKKIRTKNIEYSVMDATNLSFKNNFVDAVFDFGIIHHIPDWKKCIKEVHRVLKPNGEFLIEDFFLEIKYYF